MGEKWNERRSRRRWEGKCRFHGERNVSALKITERERKEGGEKKERKTDFRSQ